VRANGLIDTGALLAFLDADDAWHERCVDAFSDLRLPLATSGAILTELFHLLGENPRDVSAAWKLIRSGAITILPISDSDLPRLDELMKRYNDHPMDFADATLVLLAERESVTTIFSIDNNDFETYRIHGRKRFTVIPGRR
jgi:predicted nucleic acid-binding protein